MSLFDELSKTVNERAESWRVNTNDPHNINTAVYVALLEVGKAIEAARVKWDATTPE